MELEQPKDTFTHMLNLKFLNCISTVFNLPTKQYSMMVIAPLHLEGVHKTSCDCPIGQTP